MPAGSYITADPRLARDSDGKYHVQNGSPAIDAGKGNYKGVNIDMDGQPRTGVLDAGADEFSSATVKVRILKPADVGHAARFHKD